MQVLINKLFHSYTTWYLHTFMLLLDSISLSKMPLNNLNETGGADLF